jgi:hypothetical protein
MTLPYKLHSAPQCHYVASRTQRCSVATLQADVALQTAAALQPATYRNVARFLRCKLS